MIQYLLNDVYHLFRKQSEQALSKVTARKALYDNIYSEITDAITDVGDAKTIEKSSILASLLEENDVSCCNAVET